MFELCYYTNYQFVEYGLINIIYFQEQAYTIQKLVIVGIQITFIENLKSLQ